MSQQQVQQAGLSQYLISGISGSIGAILSIFILHPIDNIKLRMQIDTSNGKKSTFPSKISKVYKEEGFFGFYKGISSTIVGNFISNFVYFLIYNYLKSLLQIQAGENLKYIIAVFISGISTSVVTNPFWVIQTAQTNNKSDLSIWQTMRYLGFKKLFKGMQASFILVFNPIINYLVYENMKVYLGSIIVNENWLPAIFFISGALGKFLATMITYPYQLLRTKTHLHKEGKFNYIEQTKIILNDQGIVGLYTGLQAKLYQTVLNSAFSLMFYEEVKLIIVNLLENLDETRMIFGLKIGMIFLICIYIQSTRKVKHVILCEIFLGGFFLTIIGNLIYLIDNNEYKSISLGFFAMGLLFYIHSTLYNFTSKGNRLNAIYSILGIFIVIILGFTKLVEYLETDLNFHNILGFSLLLSLVVLSVLRYGKTSKRSFVFTILGAISLAISARLMYIEDSEQELNQYGKYFICGVQVVTQILLVLGTISHAKYGSKKLQRKLSSEFRKENHSNGVVNKNVKQQQQINGKSNGIYQKVKAQ